MKFWISFMLSIQVLYVIGSAEGISPICLMKPDSGFCMAYFPRFYYDPGTKKCESFVYGGCQGNMNNFETLKKCESTCKPQDPCKNLSCKFGAKCAVQNGGASCQCPKLCSLVYKPVCGHDGTEYSNLCLLKVAECQAQKEIKHDDGPCRFY